VQFQPGEQAEEIMARFRGYVREAGRELSAIGIEGRISVGQTPPERWGELAAAWRALGATHLSVNTMNAGFTTAQQHIDAVRRFHDAVAPVAV